MCVASDSTKSVEGLLRPANRNSNNKIETTMSKTARHTARPPEEGRPRPAVHPAARRPSLAKETSSKKQDATVEVAIRLGVDPARPTRWCAAPSTSPNGTGKTARVAVFAVGEKAEAATAAGADIVGSDDR